MDDSTWWWPVGDPTGGGALVVVVGALVLRVLPSTRRWAPRGVRPRARVARTARRAESPVRS